MSELLAFTLNEAIVQAVARLVDDAGATREPSHSDLEAVMRRVGLLHVDQHQDPAVRVGKQKRVRQVLSCAMDNDEGAGVKAVGGLISMIRGCGGFRPESPNYCGRDGIDTCVDAFTTEPTELTEDGQLRQRSLVGLSGRALTVALRSYVVRAQRGFGDSVLIAGTDKDLIEATAAHVLVERFGNAGSVQREQKHKRYPNLRNRFTLKLRSRASPLRWAHRLCVRREHDIEAHADAHVRALIRVHGVLEVGGEKQQRPVLDPHDDLVGVLGAQLRDRRPDDAGLRARIMKVDRVATWPYMDVVDATEEVVGMMVDRMRRAARIGIRPASRDLEARRPDVQRNECGARGALEPGHQSLQLRATVKGRPALPRLASRQRGQP